MRSLAFDDVIEVAGPVLTQSLRLDDAILIETARNKSQAHLMAISKRKVLSDAVTDVLVLRGNDEVVQSTVNNPGAEFSERSLTRLVNRAEGDDELATCLGLRPAIPRHLYLKLLAKASDTVRQRLEAANPKQAAEVPTAVREATRRARSSKSAMTQQTADRARAGQIAVRGRTARRAPDHAVRRGRQVRRGERGDRSACQCAGDNRREHDGGDPAPRA